MRPPSYHHNGFVATHALGHMTYGCYCAQVHELPQSHCGDNREGALYSWLHVCCAHLASVRFEHSVCRRSLMTTYVYISGQRLENKVGKELENKVELTKSLSGNSLSSLIIEKEEFSTSKGTERKVLTDIVLERGLENDFHHTRFNSLAKNVTHNRAFRKSKSKQQREVNIDKGKETDSDKTLLTYADRVKKPTEQVVDLSQICSDLLVSENGSSKMDTSPPNLCTNSAHISNDSGSPNREKNEPFFCTQDKEILSILEELEQVQSTSITGSDRISGYFCSDAVFNLSKKVLSDMEIKILEKGLDYAPIQNKVNEPALRGDFEDFARRMRLKWYF